MHCLGYAGYSRGSQCRVVYGLGLGLPGSMSSSAVQDMGCRKVGLSFASLEYGWRILRCFAEFGFLSFEVVMV